MTRKIPSVVLVGRPNVGKSTLFNRMTGSRRAIVAPVAGTTRDALARPASWGGAVFDLFDTGGLSGASEDPLHELVVRPGSTRASKGPICSCFSSMAARGSCRATRRSRASSARRGCPWSWPSTRPTTSGPAAVDFYELGFEPVVEISAEHGTGVAELLDEIVKVLPASARADSQARSDETDADDTTSTPPPCRARARSRRRGPRGHRRPPERRQVVAAQSAAEGGARARQRAAGDDTRCDRRVADVAQAALPDRGHGRDAPARARAGRRAGGARQRRGREEGDHGRRRRRAADRFEGRADRSGCRDRRRSRPRRTWRRHRGEQVGSGEEPGPAVRRRRSTTSCDAR